jgi:HK97 gp10 family phage protein
MAVTVEFSGGKELQRALLELSNKSALTVGRFALRRAANELLREVRASAPIDKGLLRRALKVRIDRGRYSKSVLSALVYAAKASANYRPRKTARQSRVKGKLGPAKYSYQIGSRPDVYGIFQEFGAPAHGLPARPWFRPAYQRSKEALLDAIARELATGLTREAMKLTKR